MSEYYFFHDKVICNKIEKWFTDTFHGTVILEHSKPVIFTVDDVTYTAKRLESSVYCVKLYGGTIKPYHNFIIDKVEKFLNKIKDE